MSTTRIFLKKLRKNGIGWLYWRSKKEFSNPDNEKLKNLINTYLRIKKKFSRRKIQEGDYLYGIYDLEASALTFNIIDFLCALEIEVQIKKKAGFVLVVVPKKSTPSKYTSDYEKIIDESTETWLVDNVIINTLRLHPKFKGLSLLPDRKTVNDVIEKYDVYPELYDSFNLRQIDIKKFYKTAIMPGVFEGLRATTQGKRYIQKYLVENNITKKIITITIRQYAYDPIRNSDLPEWKKFFDYLISRDYHPIIVPDTHNAFSKTLPFENEYIFSDCCWNTQLRMALYEAAFMNFSVPSGACSMILYNPNCSGIFMNMLPEGSEVSCDTKERFGFERENDYLKWITPRQRISLLPDKYDNIVFEFERLTKIALPDAAAPK